MTQPLNLKYDILVSKFALSKCNLYRYTADANGEVHVDDFCHQVVHGESSADYTVGLALFTTLFCSQNTNRWQPVLFM